ncbi:MAG: M48 family metalloprotease [Candidatus Obscuribacterales bacterium]|nr:M48 family metalloprotease [Candidatus Obscuribacterales bacterium]
MTAFAVFRLGSSSIAKLKAYRFEKGMTVGSILNDTLQEVASALSVKAPVLYIFPHEDRNALCTFAPKLGWIVLLSDSLEKADDDERRSVLAHELAHQKCLHTLCIFIGVALITLLGLSTHHLCEMKGLELFTSLLITSATLAVGVASMGWFARQNEFHADAIATAMNGKEGIVNNLLSRRIPMLAAIGHKVAPDLSLEHLEQHFKDSPKRIQLVLAMESALTVDAKAKGFFSKLNLLFSASLDPHPTFAQRLKNMERIETLIAA